MEPSAQARPDRSSNGEAGSGYGPSRRDANPDDATQGFGPLPGFGPPGAFGPPPEQPVAMRPDGPARARTGLVVLVAFLFELVVIAGWGNQWVSDRVNRHLDNVSSLFGRRLISSTLNYSWRFSPPGGSDVGHLWLGQLMLVVAFLVVSVLLIIPAVRGVVTFWRAFFATWTAVLAATVIAAMVRGAIIDPSALNESSSFDRASSAVFGPAGPNQSVVVAGIVFGLVVALLAAIVAVATRRRPMVAVTTNAIDGPPQRPIDAPPPYYGDAPAAGPLPRNGEDSPPYGYVGQDRPGTPEGARHAADSVQDSDTRRLPPVDFAKSASPSAGASAFDSDSTTEFPRPTPTASASAAPVTDDASGRDSAASTPPPAEHDATGRPPKPTPVVPDEGGSSSAVPEASSAVPDTAADRASSEAATPEAPPESVADVRSEKPPAAPAESDPAAADASAPEAAPSEAAAPETTAPETTRFADPRN